MLLFYVKLLRDNNCEAPLLHQAIGRLQFPGSCFASGYWEMTIRGFCFASSYYIREVPFRRLLFCVELLGECNFRAHVWPQATGGHKFRARVLRQAIGRMQFRGSCFASGYLGITIRGSVLHQAIGRLQFPGFCLLHQAIGDLQFARLLFRVKLLRDYYFQVSVLHEATGRLQWVEFDFGKCFLFVLFVECLSSFLPAFVSSLRPFVFTTVTHNASLFSASWSSCSLAACAFPCAPVHTFSHLQRVLRASSLLC